MYVYVIREKGTDFYKIGKSIHPEKRLKQAQTYNPRDLILYAYYNVGTEGIARSIEHHLHHKMFNFHHVRGEWFKLTKQHLDILNDWIQIYVSTSKQKNSRQTK